MTRKAHLIATGPHATSTVWAVAVSAAVTVASIAALILTAALHVWNAWPGSLGIAALVLSASVLVLAFTIVGDEIQEAHRQEAALQTAFTRPSWRKRRVAQSDVDTLRRLLADAERRAEADRTASKRATK
ncbi:hypothetical protein [Leifsonia sp. fls2-241-R2A-40a]|uniref:hypothetical protein n=1 Tax=Leifsonia sp. fls2-241-R2A-40a TaxID=3040290 RepID=UPI00254A2DF3|nr:hypothetical protein [Leifsonia sp. fls2-241-R2A-40a]